MSYKHLNLIKCKFHFVCMGNRIARISLATIGVCVFVRLLRWAHFLFLEAFMKRVDKLGRIVVPIELRQKYGMTEGKEVEFLDSGDGVTVKCAEPFCRLCRAEIPVSESLPLCEKCIAKVVNNYNEVK